MYVKYVTMGDTSRVLFAFRDSFQSKNKNHENGDEMIKILASTSM